jgi:hypothetical protein
VRSLPADIAVSRAERPGVLPADERPVVAGDDESTLRFFVGVSGSGVSSLQSSSDLLKETTRFGAGVEDELAVNSPFITDLDGKTADDRVFRGEDGVCGGVDVALAAGYIV